MIDQQLPSWQKRFLLRTLTDASLARSNLNRGLVAATEVGVGPQLYAWDVPAGELRRLTNREQGVGGGSIDAQGRAAYYLEDRQGNELGHLVRIPFAGGEAIDLTPDMTPYTLRGVAFSPAGNMLAFTPINHDGFQVAVLPLDERGPAGPLRILYRSDFEAWHALPSHSGELVATKSTERAGGKRLYNIIVFASADGRRVAQLWDEGASVEPVLFSPAAGDMRLLALTSRSGFRRPLIWDVANGERIDLEAAELDGDLVPLDWSPDGQRVLLSHFRQAKQQLYIWDLVSTRLRRLVHPPGSFGTFGGLLGKTAFFGPDDRVFGLWQDSIHPKQIIALGAGDEPTLETVLLMDERPTSRPLRSITFLSSDSQEIQGWLGVPAGDGPFPTILEMHGGPHAVVTEEFNPLAQAFMDHGFAFLSINFRGSTSFGQEFQTKIWGNLGHWELEDMIAARRWLVEQGIARPDGVILFGASYGGYLTLFGLGKRPELWAGGIAIVAIGDWSANYQEASDAMKGAFRAWFGGHSPEERPDLYRASSPITYVENVTAPLLIIQGRHDTRTASGQMSAYVERLQQYGKNHELIWFDAGHGGGLDGEAAIAYAARMLRFAQSCTTTPGL